MKTANQSAPAQPFQDRVQPWMMACFGPEISGDKIERNHRFLEEALELVQALDCTRHEAHTLVDYVYDRPRGEPKQEVGGVMVTLAALCLASQFDMHEEGEVELARIWMKVETIRAKQAAKPKNSPLPASPAQPGPTVIVAREIERARMILLNANPWHKDCQCPHCRAIAALDSAISIVPLPDAGAIPIIPDGHKHVRCIHGCADPVMVVYVPDGCNCRSEPIQAVCQQHWNTMDSNGPIRVIAYLATPKDTLPDASQGATRPTISEMNAPDYPRTIIDSAFAPSRGAGGEKDGLLPLSAFMNEAVFRLYVAEAMEQAWNEICSDTENHPTDIKHEGRKLFFSPEHWAWHTADYLWLALHQSERLCIAASPPAPAQGARVIVDMAKAVEQLQASPELATMMYEAMAPTLAAEMREVYEMFESAADVLRSLEWSGRDTGYSCPKCDAFKKDGHAPDCALADALRRPG